MKPPYRELVGGPHDGLIIKVSPSANNIVLARPRAVTSIGLEADEIPQLECPTVKDIYEFIDVYDEGDSKEPDRPPSIKFYAKYKGSV